MPQVPCMVLQPCACFEQRFYFAILIYSTTSGPHKSRFPEIFPHRAQTKSAAEKSTEKERYRKVANRYASAGYAVRHVDWLIMRLWHDLTRRLQKSAFDENPIILNQPLTLNDNEDASCPCTRASSCCFGRQL